MLVDLVKKARSHRRFLESDPIPPETLRELVDIARLAPCGGNQQPLRYRIVTGDECAAVFPYIAWAGALKDWEGPAEGERPTGYIAILSSADRNSPPHADMGIAAQTIQLAATDLGYAACMLGAIKRPEIHKALGLPDAWAVNLLVALGRPGETVVIEDLAPGGDTAYYRTPDGIHHVPKRTLDEVLVE